MLIPQDSAMEFIMLYTMLLYYAGDVQGVIPESMEFDSFLDEPMQTKAACREALYDPSPLFDDFLEDNEDQLSQEHQEIISAWSQRHLFGLHTIYRHMKKYTIFLDAEEPPTAYGVLSLTTDLADMIPTFRLPLYIKTALLPYKGQIVCDGLVAYTPVIIGPNIRRNMQADYKEAMNAGRLITAL